MLWICIISIDLNSFERRNTLKSYFPFLKKSLGNSNVCATCSILALASYDNMEHLFFNVSFKNWLILLIHLLKWSGSMPLN